MEVKPLPAVPYIKIPDEGEPYLEGYKCGSCGATFLGERATCSKCGARDQMSTTTLPTRESCTLILLSTDPFRELTFPT